MLIISQNCQNPFNYMIAAWMLLAKCDDYQFQLLIFQFPALEKNYHLTSMFIMTWAVNTIEMFCKEKVAPCLVRQTISWSSNKSSREHPFYLWLSLHHTFAIRNLILRCLTGSHMTILSKSNYCIRLNVNINIADSISFHFNFGKGHFFVLMVNQHLFNKTPFFKMKRVNPAIVNWREKEVETCSCCLLSFENFLAKTKSVLLLLFP